MSTARRAPVGRLTRWLPFELLVSLRFLREGRMQSVLILAGVTGGVAVIIFLTQLINQLQGSIIDRVMGSQAHIVIRPTEEVTRVPPADPDATKNTAPDAYVKSDGDHFDPQNSTTRIVQPRSQRLRPVDQWEQVAALAAATQGVLAVSPLATGPVFAQRGSSNKSVVLMGVVPAAYSRIVKMDGYMTRGRFAVQGTETLIGIELAKDLGIGVGDKLRVTTATGRAETLHINGLFDTGNRDLNRRWVFVPLKLAQTLLDMPGGVSQIDVTVTDLFNAETVANGLQARTGLTVESWMQTNAGLLTALSNQTVSNNLIRSFVVIIVALGISSVLVVSVVQKQREIGILRAMGAGRGRIMAVFLLQGGLVGLVGSALGSGLAFTLLTVFSHIYKSPDGAPLFAAELDPQLVLMASLVACAVGLAAAALPARRAARMDPVQAIRS
ncbi:MAG TPA: FtsX-like permease family protein [Burkholderiaceae bacterium]|nr:FtsX-like permease family protein [Burkholderiaceae bacterium]